MIEKQGNLTIRLRDIIFTRTQMESVNLRSFDRNKVKRAIQNIFEILKYIRTNNLSKTSVFIRPALILIGKLAGKR